MDWAQGFCDRLEEQLGLKESIPPPPPPPNTRHHESDPEEKLRKEAMQCQNCLVSRADGAVLHRCGACKVDFYCSRKCQKEAWPIHKARCQINKKAQGGRTDRLKILRDFTQKHRPSISEAGPRALDLATDPTRCKRYMLVIDVLPRPGSTRVETLFYVTGISVMRHEDFAAEKTEEMRSQLKYAHDMNVKHGSLGAFLVALSCAKEMMANIAPVGFGQEVLDQTTEVEPGRPWKEWLMTRMNEGIVS